MSRCETLPRTRTFSAAKSSPTTSNIYRRMNLVLSWWPKEVKVSSSLALWRVDGWREKQRWGRLFPVEVGWCIVWASAPFSADSNCPPSLTIRLPLSLHPHWWLKPQLAQTWGSSPYWENQERATWLLPSQFWLKLLRFWSDKPRNFVLCNKGSRDCSLA